MRHQLQQCSTFKILICTHHNLVAVLILIKQSLEIPYSTHSSHSLITHIKLLETQHLSWGKGSVRCPLNANPVCSMIRSRTSSNRVCRHFVWRQGHRITSTRTTMAGLLGVFKSVSVCDGHGLHPSVVRFQANNGKDGKLSSQLPDFATASSTVALIQHLRRDSEMILDRERILLLDGKNDFIHPLGIMFICLAKPLVLQ